MYSREYNIFNVTSASSQNIENHDNKIKEYLDNQEIEMIKLELQNLEKFYLKTDKLFFNTQT